MRTLLVLAAALLAAGCGGTRLRVVDSSTGYAVGRASVVAQDAAGRTRQLAVSNHAGQAEIRLPERTSFIYVRAEGYQTWGRSARWLVEQSGTVTVELKPAWLGAFMDGGVKPATGDAAYVVPKPCHCHTAR